VAGAACGLTGAPHAVQNADVPSIGAPHFPQNLAMSAVSLKLHRKITGELSLNLCVCKGPDTGINGLSGDPHGMLDAAENNTLHQDRRYRKLEIRIALITDTFAGSLSSENSVAVFCYDVRT
jgi:hypothetical protein